jgi:hypothetical protein
MYFFVCPNLPEKFHLKIIMEENLYFGIDNTPILCKQCCRYAKPQAFSATPSGRKRKMCTECYNRKKALQKLLNQRYQHLYHKKRNRAQKLNVEVKSNEKVDLNKLSSFKLKFNK